MTNLDEDILRTMERVLDELLQDEVITASSLAKATLDEVHDQSVSLEELTQMAKELLAARYGDSDGNLPTIKPGEGPFERRMREFCNWQTKQPLGAPYEEWRQRADAAGYADITTKQAVHWLHRVGREAKAEGDALGREIRRREIGLTAVDGGKGGDDDDAA
jgi:hypothetical protein